MLFRSCTARDLLAFRLLLSLADADSGARVNIEAANKYAHCFEMFKALNEVFFSFSSINYDLKGNK